MFGTITKGGIADLQNVTVIRHASGDGRMLHADQPDDALGVPMPKAGQTDFLVTHHAHDEMVEVCATYRTHGPTFVARAAEAEMQLLMWSERKNIEHRLSYEALQAVRAQVEAYNAVVQPIYNGPEDRVYLSETGNRVFEAVKACATPGSTPDATELEAACRANLYAADIVIANFNRRTF